MSNLIQIEIWRVTISVQIDCKNECRYVWRVSRRQAFHIFLFWKMSRKRTKMSKWTEHLQLTCVRTYMFYDENNESTDDPTKNVFSLDNVSVKFEELVFLCMRYNFKTRHYKWTPFVFNTAFVSLLFYKSCIVFISAWTQSFGVEYVSRNIFPKSYFSIPKVGRMLHATFQYTVLKLYLVWKYNTLSVSHRLSCERFEKWSKSRKQQTKYFLWQ